MKRNRTKRDSNLPWQPSHCRLRAEILEDRCLLATLTVTQLVENPTFFPVDNGQLTFREAISYVNGDFVPDPTNTNGDIIRIAGDLGEDDKIVFDSSVTGAIDLVHGDIDIRRPVRIEGPGADLLAIHAASNARIFDISYYDYFYDDPAIPVTISGLRLTGGNVFGDGGAIRSTRNVLLRDTIVDDNHAQNGGAIHVSGVGGALSVITSQIESNTAEANGGAIWFRAKDLEVIGSSITGNQAGQSASGGGGGIYLRDRIERAACAASDLVLCFLG